MLTVQVLSPAAGSRFRDRVTVRAQVSEPVSRVDFAIASQTVTGAFVADKTYEAELDLAGLAEGDQAVTVTAVGLLGDKATAGVGIVVDRTPRPARRERITAEESDAGFAIVQGLPSAVERRAGLDTIRVEATNVATGAVVTVTAAQDGTFAARLLAQLGCRAPGGGDRRRRPPQRGDGRRRQEATAEGGVPLNGLELWVRAVDLDEPDEVDPATGAVLLWRDRSVNQNHLAAAKASARPGSPRRQRPAGRALRRRRRHGALHDPPDDDPDGVLGAVGGGGRGIGASRSLLGDDCGAGWRGRQYGSPGALCGGSAASQVLEGQTWVNGQWSTRR